MAVRSKLDEAGFKDMPISTNIGEDQPVRSTACQSALGVAVAGADYVKCGLAGLEPKSATYLGRNLVRTVRDWFPERKVYHAVFPDEDLARFFDPLADGPALVGKINSDGLLIDTYHKDIGKGLMDYYSIEQLSKFVADLHALGKEAWLAGSLSKDDLTLLWAIDVDVICVRGAACEQLKGEARFGAVTTDMVNSLVLTLDNEN